MAARDKYASDSEPKWMAANKQYAKYRSFFCKNLELNILPLCVDMQLDCCTVLSTIAERMQKIRPIAREIHCRNVWVILTRLLLSQLQLALFSCNWDNDGRVKINLTFLQCIYHNDDKPLACYQHCQCKPTSYYYDRYAQVVCIKTASLVWWEWW